MSNQHQAVFDDTYFQIDSMPRYVYWRTIHTKLHGVSFYNRQSIIRKSCSAGNAIFLSREKDNVRDANAIRAHRIIVKENAHWISEQLGYLSHELATDLAPRIDAGSYLTATITAITGNAPGKTLGVNIEIKEYRPIDEQKKHHRARSASPPRHQGTAAP